ncbi:MAG: hypothetical protein WAN10_02200, partial [Candidatus Acidiferrales bacterium]
MSVVASVKVYDGIVIGAESMTQLLANVPGAQQPMCIKSYSHAQKIFQIAKLPIGVLTYGMGNIGSRSMESLVHDFSQLEERDDPERVDKSVEGVARRLHAFINQHYPNEFRAVAEAQRPMVGFYIAGYSAGQQQHHLGSEWEFIIPQQAEPVRARDDNGVGASWRGIHVPFTRLFFGVDPRIEGILQGLGVSADVLARFRQAVQMQLISRVAFEGMPIQDAVGFCRFIIQTTIGMATYEIGIASCGGPIHTAVITRSGFK